MMPTQRKASGNRTMDQSGIKPAAPKTIQQAVPSVIAAAGASERYRRILPPTAVTSQSWHSRARLAQAQRRLPFLTASPRPTKLPQVQGGGHGERSGRDGTPRIRLDPCVLLSRSGRRASHRQLSEPPLGLPPVLREGTGRPPPLRPRNRTVRDRH